MKPKPLGPILRSPRDLLRKAAEDLDRLDEVTWLGGRSRDSASFALLDACSALYQINDWIGVTHPGYKIAAQECIDSSLWLRICKDVCTASKHVQLDLEHKTYRRSPPATREVDHTISAQVSLFEGRQVLKIRTADQGDYLATDVIDNAIREWEAFLSGKAID